MYILNMNTAEVASSETNIGSDTSAEAVDSAFASEEASSDFITPETQVEGEETQAPDPVQPAEGEAKAEPEASPEWIDRIKQFKPDVDVSDPNAVQEATWDMYRDMEKMHSPVKQELEALKEQSESVGNTKQLMDWINENPDRAKEAQEFVEELQQRELRQKFGEELPDEVLNQLREAETTKQRLDQMETTRQQESEDKALDNALKSVETLAKGEGKEFDEQVLLDYMQKEGVMNPMAAYKAMNYDNDLTESKRQGGIDAQKKIQEANKNGVVFHKGTGGSTPSKGFGSEQEADSSMAKDIMNMLAAKGQ